MANEYHSRTITALMTEPKHFNIFTGNRELHVTLEPWNDSLVRIAVGEGSHSEGGTTMRLDEGDSLVFCLENGTEVGRITARDSRIEGVLMNPAYDWPAVSALLLSKGH
jgi:hypothetical protein